MKGKIILILILSMFLFAAAPAIGTSVLTDVIIQPLNYAPNPPIIEGCFNGFVGHGEEVDEAYAKVLYNYKFRNINPYAIDIIIDWGDGDSETIDDVVSYLYAPHEYAHGPGYIIRAKAVYQGVESAWSDPFVIPVIDHCDLSIVEFSTVPPNFRPGQTIDIAATIKNEGSIPTTSSHIKVTFYEGYEEEYSKMIGEPQYVGKLNPDQEQQVSVSFKWYKDKYSHGMLAVVEVISNERTDINNRDIGNFNAPRAISRILVNPIFLILFERFTRLSFLL